MEPITEAELDRLCREHCERRKDAIQLLLGSNPSIQETTFMEVWIRQFILRDMFVVTS